MANLLKKIKTDADGYNLQTIIKYAKKDGDIEAIKKLVILWLTQPDTLKKSKEQTLEISPNELDSMVNELKQAEDFDTKLIYFSYIIQHHTLNREFNSANQLYNEAENYFKEKTDYINAIKEIYAEGLFEESLKFNSCLNEKYSDSGKNETKAAMCTLLASLMHGSQNALYTFTLLIDPSSTKNKIKPQDFNITIKAPLTLNVHINGTDPDYTMFAVFHFILNQTVAFTDNHNFFTSLFNYFKVKAYTLPAKDKSIDYLNNDHIDPFTAFNIIKYCYSNGIVESEVCLITLEIIFKHCINNSHSNSVPKLLPTVKIKFLNLLIHLATNTGDSQKIYFWIDAYFGKDIFSFFQSFKASTEWECFLLRKQIYDLYRKEFPSPINENWKLFGENECIKSALTSISFILESIDIDLKGIRMFEHKELSKLKSILQEKNEDEIEVQEKDVEAQNGNQAKISNAQKFEKIKTLCKKFNLNKNTAILAKDIVPIIDILEQASKYLDDLKQNLKEELKS